jgi:hypothetical protein
MQRHTINLKTFMSKVATVVTIVVVLFGGWFALSRRERAMVTHSNQPTDASVQDGVYTNNFFQFAVRFPASWKVLPLDSKADVRDSAVTYQLLLAGSGDSQIHGVRFIAIFAARPPESSQPFSFTAEDIAKREADGLKAAKRWAQQLCRNCQPIAEPANIKIQGRQLTRLDIAGQVNTQGKDYDAVASLLTTMERGYLIVFLYSDPKGRENENGAARKSIDTLQFSGKTN